MLLFEMQNAMQNILGPVITVNMLFSTDFFFYIYFFFF